MVDRSPLDRTITMFGGFALAILTMQFLFNIGIVMPSAWCLWGVIMFSSWVFWFNIIKWVMFGDTPEPAPKGITPEQVRTMFYELGMPAPDNIEEIADYINGGFHIESDYVGERDETGN